MSEYQVQKNACRELNVFGAPLNDLSARMRLLRLLGLRRRSRFAQDVGVAEAERLDSWKVRSVRDAVSQDWIKKKI
jgi:hypothetical protein